MKKIFSILVIFSLLFVFSCASGGKFKAYDPAGNSWDWNVDNDKSNGGTSTITMTEETQEGMPAYAFKGSITNEYVYGFVNVQIRPDTATLEQLKTITAFSFRILGDGDRYAVKITTSDVEDYAYYEYAFETIEGQPMTIIVPVEYLMQPSWGKKIGVRIKLENSMFIEFQTTRNGSPGPYEFKLWDLRLYTAGVPEEKDLAPKTKTKAPAPAAAPAASKGIGGDLGAFTLKLNDNFQYGDGYQGVFSDRRLFNGHKIVPGETYNLKITYTASRDLEDMLLIGLVDVTAAAGYFKALSWDDSQGIGMASIPASKAGEKVSAELTLKTTATSTGASGTANSLVILSNGAGLKGSANSGKKGPVTLSFSEFVFTEVK